MAMLMYWTHDCPAPWQTPEWIEQMRQQLRPNAFLRLIENRWVTNEGTFVDMAWLRRLRRTRATPRALTDPRLAVWVGVDASVKRDSTAIVCCTFDQAAKKVRLVWHRIFQPSPNDPLLFEDTIERTLLDLRRRFWVREVRFDPYQMQAVARRASRPRAADGRVPRRRVEPHRGEHDPHELTKGRILLSTLTMTCAWLYLAASRSTRARLEDGEGRGQLTMM